MVRGGTPVADAAGAALTGAFPDLVLKPDGTPESALGTDDKALAEHALCRVLHALIDAAGRGGAKRPLRWCKAPPLMVQSAPCDGAKRPL